MRPLGHKAYGSIPHLPGSRLGPGEHTVHEGQARICTEKARDKHDEIWVEEKLDGSCCAVAKIDGKIIPLGRSGYIADSSEYEQHQLFAAWVVDHLDQWHFSLNEGERWVGEWLAQAHGTRYDGDSQWFDPFVVFDLMCGYDRAKREERDRRAVAAGLRLPMPLSREPRPIEHVNWLLGEHGFNEAIDPAEGFVYRVERHGKVDFLAKYVRPDKIDGRYLPSQTGEEPVWNWLPEMETT